MNRKLENGLLAFICIVIFTIVMLFLSACNTTKKTQPTNGLKFVDDGGNGGISFRGGDTLRDWVVIDGANGITGGIHLNRPDTTAFIFLVADTSYKPGLLANVFVDSGDSTNLVGRVKNRVPFIYWVFGYVVLGGNINIEYLDQDHKPLSKKIAVLGSVEIR